MRSRPMVAKTMTAIGGAGLVGLAFLAAPAPARAVEDGGPPQERPAKPEAPAAETPPETPPAPDRDGAKSAADSVADQVQQLADKIGKQAEPVTEEVRKAVGDAFSTLADALRRDDVSTDDLTGALERARDELTRAFQEGGSINRSARKALRNARDEVRDNLEKSRNEARDALRKRYDAERERLGETADDLKAKVKEKADELVPDDDQINRDVEAEFRDDPEVADLYRQKAELQRRLEHIQKGTRAKDDPVRAAHQAELKELTNKIDQLWRERYRDLSRKAREAADAKADDEGADVSDARRRVRELQKQLREAERELQRTDGRRGERKPAPLRGRVGPVRIGPNRSGPEADRRLDALEAKMDRVLKALEGLVTEKPEADDADNDDE